MSRKLQHGCLILAFIIGIGTPPSARFGVINSSWHLGRVYRIQPPKTVMGAALSPNGHQLAVEMRWGFVTPQGEVSQVIDELQLWDVDRQKEIAKTELASRPNLVPDNPVVCLLRFTQFSSNGREIAVCDGRNLQILDAHTLAPVRKIDLRLPVLPRRSDSNLAIDAVALSPDGQRLALTLSDNLNGTVRIYSLVEGNLVIQWKYKSINVGPPLTRIAWSPNGEYLALTVYPVIPGQRMPKEAPNVLVYITRDGELARSIHTGYLAGPVAFASNDLLLVGSLERAMGPHREDAIEEWSLNSGKLVRQFASSPYGNRYQLAVSGDERILVGYVAKERMADDFVQEAVQRFQLWDLSTGDSLYLSDPIQLSPVGWRSTQLETDLAGNRVLVWKQATKEPLLVYDLRPSN